MPIYIQTGGGAAQLGAGLGAGFSKGVSDEFEQQRKKDLMEAEAAIRRDLLQEKRGYERELLQEERDYQRGVTKEGRDYERELIQDERGHQLKLLQEGREYERGVIQEEREHERGVIQDEREYQEGLTAQLEQDASQIARSNFQRMTDARLQEYTSTGGASSDWQAAGQKAISEAQRSVTPDMGPAEIAGVVQALDMRLATITGQREENEIQAALAELTEPDPETGLFPIPESEVMALQALASQGNLANLQMGIAQAYADRERRESATKYAAGVAQEVGLMYEDWKAQPVPKFIKPEEKEGYAGWRMRQDVEVQQAIERELRAFGRLRHEYDADDGMQRIKALLHEVDPYTEEVAFQQRLAREGQTLRQEERIKAEERYVYSAVQGDPEGRRKDAERGDPDREMSYAELVGEAVRLFEAGDLVGAAQATVKAEALKPKE